MKKSVAVAAEIFIGEFITMTLSKKSGNLKIAFHQHHTCTDFLAYLAVSFWMPLTSPSKLFKKNNPYVHFLVSFKRTSETHKNPLNIPSINYKQYRFHD